MSQPADPDLQHRPDPDPDAVCDALEMCQRLLEEARKADGVRLVEVHVQFERASTHLWDLMEPPLTRAAGRWRRSRLGRQSNDALRNLAMNMFTAILFELPRIKADRGRNPCALLVTIAWRGMSAEQRRDREPPPRRPKNKQDPVAPGTLEVSMAPPLHRQDGIRGVFDGETHEPLEPVDPASLDLEEQRIRRIMARDVWVSVWQEWSRILSPDDLRIVDARWKSDPPVPFAAIASHLGPGWTEDNVRQRHARILEKARESLRRRGLM